MQTLCGLRASTNANEDGVRYADYILCTTEINDILHMRSGTNIPGRDEVFYLLGFIRRDFSFVYRVNPLTFETCS